MPRRGEVPSASYIAQLHRTEHAPCELQPKCSKFPEVSLAFLQSPASIGQLDIGVDSKHIKLPDATHTTLSPLAKKLSD